MNNDVPSTMRALVLDGTGFDHLRVRRVATPRPGPGQLLARVDAAGICTSLIKLVEQGPEHQFLYGWDIERWPLILGDEGSVTIVEVGAELETEFARGERYVVQPAVEHAPINHRERYRDQARGVDKVAVGYTLGGNLAEYILISEEILEAGCLLPVDDPTMAYGHASLAEPLSCVVSAQDHHVHLTQDAPLSPRGVLKGIRPAGVVVIVGAGVMGRMHVDIALSCRPRAIVVSDLIDSRLDLVGRLFGDRSRALGVELRVVNPAEADLSGVVDELTEFGGADDVIVAVGSARAIESAQHLVGRGGVLNLFGGLKAGQADVSLDSRIIHYKEINVTGSSGGSPWDIARTLEIMAQGSIDAAAHITRIGDLDHAAEFLAQVKAQEIDGKAIVYPHRRTEEVLSVTTWTCEDEAAYLGGV